MKLARADFDVVADDLRGGRAGFAVVDGRFEELGPLEFSVALVEVPPGVEGAGDRDGDSSVGRQGSVFARERSISVRFLGERRCR